MPKISVIVPVYNVEKYLKRSIISILKQTFKDFELIIVNDGSTDRSAELVSELIMTDKRCRLYDKPNGGLSDARNYGLDKAKAEYVVFVDSDDYIKNTFLQRLYEAVTENSADAALCMYDLVDEDGKFIKHEKCNISKGKKVISGKELLESSMMPDGVPSIVAWNKIYKREMFEHVRYTVGRTHEDEIILAPLFWNVKRVAIVNQNEYLYNYVQRSGSIMNSKRNRQAILDEEFYNKKRLNFYRNRDKKLYELAADRYKDWIHSITNVDDLKLISNDEKRKLKKIFKELKREARKPESKKERIKDNLISIMGLEMYAKLKYIVRTDK